MCFSRWCFWFTDWRLRVLVCLYSRWSARYVCVCLVCAILTFCVFWCEWCICSCWMQFVSFVSVCMSCMRVELVCEMFCLICDVYSCSCVCSGSIFVWFCRCWTLMCVQPVHTYCSCYSFAWWEWCLHVLVSFDERILNMGMVLDALAAVYQCVCCKRFLKQVWDPILWDVCVHD